MKAPGWLGTVALLVMGMSTLPGAAFAQSGDVETRVEISRQIIDIAYPEAERFAMFSKVADQMETQMRQSVEGLIDDEGASEIIRRYQADVREKQSSVLEKHIPLLMDAWVTAYADIFSEKELRDILSFVRTDSGRTFMMRSTDVLSNQHFAAANQAYIDDAMGVAMQEMPKMMEEIVAYKQAQQAE